ncbi:MAG: tyrosine-type recombinase/integrase [Candidatus Nanohaloarchaea archaeon]
MTQGDIHNRDRVFERLENQIKTSSSISDRDKKILLEGGSDFPSFVSYMQNEDLSQSRINRYLRTWKRILEKVSWQIEEIDGKKMTDYVGQLNTDQITKKNGEPFSSSTKREIKKGIRKMYTDYIERNKQHLDLSEGFKAEEIISFTLTIDRKFTDPDRLPTPNTVKQLVENADRPRDKAYIMLLWSSGGRHAEVLGLKWKDVRFSNSIGKVVFRDTKTGGDHSVPMAEAYPFMYQHRENDLRGQDPEAFVFRSLQSDEQLSGNGAAEIINRIRSKDSVDIPERIKTNPHAYRKGRTSYWARQGKNEAWICKHMNWAPGSEVVRHYCRLAQENVEAGVAQHLGLEHEEQGEDESQVLTPSECHGCGTVNSFQADVCQNCGTALQTSELYNEVKIQEMKEEIKSEMIEQETGKSRDEIREIAEEVVEDELGV